MKSIGERYSQGTFPLWSKVIFVDWHGVLSADLFWQNVLSSKATSTKRVQHALRRESEALFREQRDRVRDWMRGNLSSSEIVGEMSVPLNGNYRDDYVLRALMDNCRRARVDEVLVKVLQAFRQSALVAIATDNMDCFFEVVHSLGSISGMADDILCSSEIGVLKSDSVYKFFGPWLADRGLTFNSALLIDDSEDTCEAFTAAGGWSILYRFGRSEQIQDPVARWLLEGTGECSSQGTR